MDRKDQLARRGRQLARWVLNRVRPGTVIPDDVPIADLFGHMLSYGFALLRGYFVRLHVKRSGPLFCESGVHIFGGHNVRIGRGVLLERSVTILARGGSVELGDSVVVGRFSILEAASGIREPGGKISIDNASSLGDFCYVGGSGGVHIGTGVLIGQYVSFHAENHATLQTEVAIRRQGVSRQGITVEDDCWIGAGARILDGVTLARGTVVGSGAVVTRSTLPNQVIVGVPAQPIRTRGSNASEV